MLAVEAQAHAHPSLAKMRAKVYFLNWPTTQLRFRVLDQVGFKPSPLVMPWFRRSKKRIGDSVIVENSNKKARKVETNNASDEVAGQMVFHTIRREGYNAIEERGIPHIAVPAGTLLGRQRDLGSPR